MLSDRDEFAARVLPVLVKAVLDASYDKTDEPDWEKAIAQTAYSLADAMMRERSESVAVKGYKSLHE